MRSVRILVLGVSGCRGLLGIDRLVGAPDDAQLDAPAVCASWQPRGIDPCAFPPAPALHLPAGQYVYDTTTAGGTLFDGARNRILDSPLTGAQADGPTVAVLSVDALAIDAGATLSATGAKPLVVLSWSTITIDGAIDASSHIGVIDVVAHTAQTVQFGAGANEGCGANIGGGGADAGPDPGGSGGGGGGGFQGPGGSGSPGGTTAVKGGSGGSVLATTALRGGCPGGASGAAGSVAQPPASASSQAQGGAGGGAIRLVAQDALTIAGSISANGAGGAGAPTHSACGGGGGGGGGELELEAPSLTLSGVATANGGGGGGGGSATNPGNDGVDGRVDVVGAPGGASEGAMCGDAGGLGSALTQLGGATAGDPYSCGGGGGGGGGAGVIVVASASFTATAAAKISPPVSIRR